ncbi:insulin-like growth factor-binding protein complex acid labile subunit isoform X1 [Drosophila gunungcola]|uniref:insulin-like growth factor-binding protein complex acid labile subunit isoform X1 n=1 Tax=Drosophila gunungcola TaxID=103775 RepID=UPI0022DF6916|nr:insulin-like growth factor-binding protein complex acid labile subunit isoform X1 [Drosophila gunungcola]
MYQLPVSLLLLILSFSFRVSCLQLSNCNKTEVTLIRDTELLTSLTLSNCTLPHLENAFFVRFDHLLQLELQHSGLSDLDDFSLNGLIRLQSLSLGHNNLSALRSWSSEPLGALSILDLSHNRLSKLRAKSFELYPQLQQLDLQNNQINQIEENSFYGLPHLKHLHLNGNQLQKLDSSFFRGLHRLSSLSLQHNQIDSIEMESFEGNTHLRSLRLDQNLLSSLTFISQRGLARLVHLNLSNNLVQKLEPLGFSKNFELQNLDLSFNNLTKLSKDALSGLDSLERLNISHNCVDEMETESLESLVALLQIDVSLNRLTTLPETLFHANTQLEEIILANNQIVKLSPKIFHKQNHVRYMKLNGNALDDADFLHRLSPSLNSLSLYVDLSSNRLSSVNLSSLLRFRYLNLADNNWNCAWLVANLVRKLPNSVNFARPWSVINDWSENITNIEGVDCYEGESNRSIILLDVSAVPLQKTSNCECGQTYDDSNPSPPPLTWPKIPTDRFDSRSVIIWMLVAIAIAFAGLRWLRRFVDRNEKRKLGTKELNNMYVSKVQWQPVRNELERS